MKILLLLSSLEIGGAENQALAFAQFLKANKHDVEIIGLSESGMVDLRCATLGIGCKSLVDGSWVVDKWMRVLRKLHIRDCTYEELQYYPRAYFLKYYVMKHSIDAVYAYCRPANITVGVLKRIGCEAKCIWMQRDAGIADNCVGLQPLAAVWVDEIIANSYSGYSWILQAYQREARIIHNGVKLASPIETREIWRAKLRLEANDSLAVMVANLSTRKNHLSILKTWELLLEEHEMPYAKLALAGRFDDAYEMLQQYVDDNKLAGNVFFLGQVEDIPGLLCASDLCVFGAISEGSPNGIIEAMMAGLPVVATDIPEIRDVVSDENLPFLFGVDDYQEAARKIMKLIEKQDVWKSISKANKRKAERMFNSERNFFDLLREASK